MWPPPIPFVSRNPKLSKKKTSTADKEDKIDSRSFDVPLDPDDDSSDTYEYCMSIYHDSHHEKWVIWKIVVKDFLSATLANHDTAKQHQIYQHLLKRQKNTPPPT